MSLRRLAQAPLLHFLLLGGVLQLLQPLLQDRFAAPGTIVVSAAQLEQLRGEWQRETGTAPSTVQLQASLRRHIDEEMLLREALRLGLEQRDPVARSRLLRNLRFARPDTPDDDASLLLQARALGMPSRDRVVRRRLVQLMEHRLIGEIRIDAAGLRDYIARHPQRYAHPARHGFRQVFFSGDSPGAERRAARALRQLQAGADAADLGEAFALGPISPPASASEIGARFGIPFAQAVGHAPLQAWIGPLASPYGWHLLRVEQRIAAQAADPAAIRTQAAYAWRAEREPQLLREALDALQSRYRIETPALQLAGDPRP